MDLLATYCIKNDVSMRKLTQHLVRYMLEEDPVAMAYNHASLMMQRAIETKEMAKDKDIGTVVDE